MHKLLILVAAVGLVAASCGGGDAGGSTCESIADDAIQTFQGLIDEMDALSLDELAALDEDPPAIADMQTKVDALQAQANDIGCDDATMEGLLNARVGDLTSDGFFGDLLIGELESSGFSGITE